jgi:hypothetical protein
MVAWLLRLVIRAGFVAAVCCILQAAGVNFQPEQQEASDAPEKPAVCPRQTLASWRALITLLCVLSMSPLLCSAANSALLSDRCFLPVAVRIVPGATDELVASSAKLMLRFHAKPFADSVA